MVLQGNLSLHDVEDLEAFVASFLQRSRLEPPPPWSQEDFLADLVSFVWELSLDYDGSQGSRFSAWARYKLGHESVNWIRRKSGRTRWTDSKRWPETGGVYERALPTVLSYEQDIGRPLEDRVVRPYANQFVDTTPDRSPDLMRVLGEGSGTEPGSEDGMGKAPARVAA